MVGLAMVKIYKYNSKLAIYLPFDVIKTLGLSEGDEIEFFQYSEKTFVFAKKSDVTSLLLGSQQQAARMEPASEHKQAPSGRVAELNDEEIAVLKKLDTMRYPERTAEKVATMLNPAEKETLRQLVKRKVVVVFKSEKDDNQLYSISKSIYDRFLMRKRLQAAPAPRPQQQAPRIFQRPEFRGAAPTLHPAETNENVQKLEKNGYIVLQTEGEASSVSMSLEESIRRGQVLGTRAFNKKFYIVMRSFMDRKADPVIKELREGASKVSEIAERTRMDEDAVRAVLYMLSENGDVSEKKRDVFTLA